jgi:hypothetical protein
MAKSRRKSNGCKRNTYKRKPMGKGWSTDRRVVGSSRPVLRLTESEKGSDGAAADKQD